MACHRHTDAQIAREIGQQTHGGEFGDADGETAHCQRQMDDTRVKDPLVDAIWIHEARAKEPMYG